MLPDLIAVISDTHGELPERLLERLACASEIWHLGDVDRPELLEPLKELPARLAVAQGNCDPPGLWPQQLEFERHAVRFRLQHRPPTSLSGDVAAILHGHLHVPRDERLAGIRVLSPGAVAQPRRGSSSSFAWIRFAGRGEWSWELETL